MYKKAGKRILDLCIAMPLVIALAPVMAMIAALLRAKLGSPVSFRQIRPGLQGKPFIIYKFRTMSEDREPKGNLLPDTHRLDSLGRVLRMASLDELPELFNVLKGDMSLVGPRPLLMQYLGRYTPEQARRHEVRPGITGWAQVHGRNSTPFSERLAMDVWYVDNCSLWVDLRILVMTAFKVLKREDVVPDQDVSEVDDCGLYCQPSGTEESP